MPPTLQALLAARLDQLEPAERRGARARRGRGRDLPPGRRPGARTRGDAGHAAPGRARPQGADPPRPAAARRRGRLPLPPPADPRRRLRRAAEGGPGRAARALRRLARGARRRSSSSWTRSSATTSSRPAATGRSWARPTHSDMRSRPGPASGWHAPEAGQSCDMITTQDSTCSSGRPGCFPTRTDTRGSRSTSAGRVSTRDTAWRPYRGWLRLPIARRRQATALPSSASASSGRTSSSCSCRLPKPRQGNSASSPSRRFRCSRRPATSGGSLSRVVHF